MLRNSKETRFHCLLAVGVLCCALESSHQFCVVVRQLLPLNKFVDQFAVGLRVWLFSKCLKTFFLIITTMHVIKQIM